MPNKVKNHEPQKPINGVNTQGFTARVNRQRIRNNLAKQSRRVNR